MIPKKQPMINDCNKDFLSREINSGTKPIQANNQRLKLEKDSDNKLAAKIGRIIWIILNNTSYISYLNHKDRDHFAQP